MGVLQLASADENVERFNRARYFFGDPAKRWNDRLCLEGSSEVEEYGSGRIAFIMHCEITTVQVFEYESVGLVNEVRPKPNEIIFVVLKANTIESHKLQHWNQELMLIHDVHVVHGPKGKIPSLVGFYRIEYKNLNGRSDLLIFQSRMKGSYEFFPRIADWEPCPFGRSASASDNNLVVHKIQGTPEVMQGIPHDKRGFSQVEGAGINLNPEKICSDASIFEKRRVFIDMEAVKVRCDEIAQQGVKVVDVLQGPFNLFV
jgi:hypothetical protein